METAGIERALLSNFGLRTSPAMREYVMKQLESGTAKEIPIIAGDARRPACLSERSFPPPRYSTR